MSLLETPGCRTRTLNFITKRPKAALRAIEKEERTGTKVPPCPDETCTTSELLPSTR